MWLILNGWFLYLSTVVEPQFRLTYMAYATHQ